jgi:hypothetical protein
LASVFSWSDWRLFLELEPRRKPRLRTDDFFCAELGVAGDDKLASVGEIVDFTRSRAVVVFLMGEVTGGDTGLACSFSLGGWADCEDERRKKGMEDGVSRRVEVPRRREEEGLRGVWVGARPPFGWLALARDPVAVRGCNWSGEDEIAKLGARDAAGDSRSDPTEDIEPKDAAEAIASGWDHASIDLLVAKGGTATWDGALVEIGLVIDFPEVSRGEAGEPVNLTLRESGLKLHFFDGVLGVGRDETAAGSWVFACDDDVAGEKTFVEGGDGKAGTASRETVRSGSDSSCRGTEIGGKWTLVDDCGGDRKLDRSFGRGGTGGTCSGSNTSFVDTRDAALSFKEATSLEWAEMSLPALFLLALSDKRWELADTDVKLVPTDILPESRELTVGVPV